MSHHYPIRMKPTKVIGIYSVIMHYRVGVYERLGSNPKYDFELLHGKSEKNSKKKNYTGVLSFKSTELSSVYLPVKTNNGESSQQLIPGLFFSLIRRNPDVIWCEGASSLINASFAFLYAKLFRKKFIWWSLGLLKGRTYKGIRAKIDKYIHYIERHSDAIFTYSTLGKEHFVNNRGIDPEKVFVSVNVIDTEKKIAEMASLSKKEHEGFHIVFVGAIIKVKRLKFLIDTFQKLSQKYDHIVLDIIGSGDYFHQIQEYANSKNNSRIILHGRMDGVELSQMLLSSDVLVLPGLGGLAICDGMIHSLPIVCGSADGTELDLIDESCGFVTDDMTEEFLIKNLTNLIEDPILAKEMGDNAYKRIITQFSINNYMTHLEECIDFVSKK